MNKKSFVKGKYLEPLIGAGAGSLIIAASPGVENTKGNLAASAAVGGIGMSALGRLAAKQGADIQRIDRIPRNYFFKGTGRNYVSEGNTTAEKIRNARQAATTAAEQEDNSIFSHLHVKADFTDSVRPLYEKKLNPRIKDVQDTLFGLDFRKKFTKNLNKAQAPLDAESRWSTLEDDLLNASMHGRRKRYGFNSSSHERPRAWRESYNSKVFPKVGLKLKDGKFIDGDGNPLKKADIKKKLRKAAMKHHPDRGGDEKVMKAVNKEWEDIKNTPGFDKMAYLIWKGYQLK